DPVSGRQRWRHELAAGDAPVAEPPDCLGPAYWQGAGTSTETACAHRLFAVSGGLIVLDPRDGTPCGSSGSDSPESAREVPASADSIARSFPAPPVVVGDVIVFGHPERSDRGAEP